MHDVYRGTVSMAASATSAPVLETSEAATASSSDKCWVFVHLQKSGGTTLRGILQSRWGYGYALYHSRHWTRGAIFLQSFGQQLASGSWNVIAGGYTEALRRSRSAADKCQWFTQFRHPIPRLVSAYYYCKRAKKDPACASEVVNANEVDLEMFAKHWGNFALRQFALSAVNVTDVMEYAKTDAAREQLPRSTMNVSSVPGWYLLKMYQVSHVALSEREKIPDAALYDMLQPVQNLLRDNYTAIGILEDFDTTLSLYDVALSMPGVNWHDESVRNGKKIVERKYAKQEAASLAEAWTNSEIRKYMLLDIALYEHAVDIFHKQTQAYGITS